jgi:hypothetical protein
LQPVGRGLLPTDVTRMFYASVVSTGMEITMRQRVVWNQQVGLLLVIAPGYLSMVMIYDQMNRYSPSLSPCSVPTRVSSAAP